MATQQVKNDPNMWGCTLLPLLPSSVGLICVRKRAFLFSPDFSSFFSFFFFLTFIKLIFFNRKNRKENVLLGVLVFCHQRALVTSDSTVGFNNRSFYFVKYSTRALVLLVCYMNNWIYSHRKCGQSSCIQIKNPRLSQAMAKCSSWARKNKQRSSLEAAADRQKAR